MVQTAENTEEVQCAYEIVSINLYNLEKYFYGKTLFYGVKKCISKCRHRCGYLKNQ